MVKNVMRQPRANPIIRPIGIPNTMAMADPEATMLRATGLKRSDTMRAAMGERIDQNTEWLKATPMRDAISIPKLFEKNDSNWKKAKLPTTHSIRRRISMRDTHIISGNDIIITTQAYTDMSIPVSAADI